MELAILTTYLNSSYFTTLPLNSELDVPTLLSQDQGQAQERLCPRTLGTEPHRASLFQRLWPLKLREKSRRWFFYRLKMWPKGHPSEGDWSKETIYGAKSTNRAWPHFLHIIDIQIIVAPNKSAWRYLEVGSWFIQEGQERALGGICRNNEGKLSQWLKEQRSFKARSFCLFCFRKKNSSWREKEDEDLREWVTAVRIQRRQKWYGVMWS